jgi:uncharacterized protein YbjQ (UPF0145 family)
MLIVTTDQVEGRRIVEYLGIVSGDAIVGANMFRDLFARVRDVVGGRAGGYEKALRGAKDAALEDLAEEARSLGADAIVGPIWTTRASALHAHGERQRHRRAVGLSAGQRLIPTIIDIDPFHGCKSNQSGRKML